MRSSGNRRVGSNPTLSVTEDAERMHSICFAFLYVFMRVG